MALVLAVAVFALPLGLAAFPAGRALLTAHCAAILFAAAAAAAAVALAGCIVRLRREAEAARHRAPAGDDAAFRLFAALAAEVEESLKAILRAGTRLDQAALPPEQAEIIARMRLAARAALVQAGAAPAYAAVAAGEFAPETRPFDLYQLIHGTVAALRPQAADRGSALIVRIDPRLPYELRGWPHQLRQLVTALVAGALRHSQRPAIEVRLDLAAAAGDGVRLRLLVRDHGTRAADRDAGPARMPGADGDAALAAAARLAAAMGGAVEFDTGAHSGLVYSVELPFALDRAAAALLLDLDRLPVLVATDDARFADELAAALQSWRAEPLWIGMEEPALAEIEAMRPDRQRPVLIVDGRGEVLAALSWAYRATKANPTAAPFVLFVADEPRIDSVIGLADGQLDAILPAPFTRGVLQSTLHALCVGAADWFPAELPTPAAKLPPPPDSRVAPPADSAPEMRPELMPEPMAEPDTRSAPAMPEPPPRRRLRVLVAAANAANRKIIERILATAGHAADLAADAGEAAAALAANPIDAVLLDFAALGDGEVAIAEECRAAEPGIPIIALSGDAAAGELLDAAGVDTVLGKPVEPSRLIAAIETAVFGAPAPPPVTAASITEISSHPRFGRIGAAPIDRRAVDALWSLGGGGRFFQDVVAAFRADARQFLAQIRTAAAAGDSDAFAAGVQGLRRCAASFGGTKLRDLLQSAPGPGPRELRIDGPDYVQQLTEEVARLDDMLANYRKAGE